MKKILFNLNNSSHFWQHVCNISGKQTSYNLLKKQRIENNYFLKP